MVIVIIVKFSKCTYRTLDEFDVEEKIHFSNTHCICLNNIMIPTKQIHSISGLIVIKIPRDLITSINN